MPIAVVRTDVGFHVEHGGRYFAVDPAIQTTADLMTKLETVAAAADGVEVEVEIAEMLSPVTAPCRVVAQMVNYRSHAHDSGMDPEHTPAAFFRKASSSISGPYDDVVRPAHVSFLDYEVELGLVIGAEVPIGTTVTDETLAGVVGGLVVANDVSARDLQLPKTQFYESKSYPTFTPLGPRLVLTTASDLARLPELRLTLEVDGTKRQDALASDVIVGPAAALTLLSRFQPLEPGDVLLTGTPGGTALRAPHRVVEMVGRMLPAHARWAAFFKRQADNPAYLQEGQVMTTSIRTDDGALDLGRQVTPVRVAAA